MDKPRLTNLAPLPTPFVGRTSALRALTEALARSRLVTVLGPPGTGKTRLVKEHALARMRSDDPPPGGAFFCDLTETTTAQGVLVVIANTIGADNLAVIAPFGAEEAEGDSKPQVFDNDLARRVEAAIAARPGMLLVLDNFEQLVRTATGVVARLAEAAPAGTTFLVTSRERLHLPGETLLDLGPLELPPEPSAKGADPVGAEAVDLFILRARAALHTFEPSAAEMQAIARLVRLLDGLPLAIELAAARVRLLTPAELIERFGSRFGWLTHDASALRSRRATLLETIETSWALLAPWEQAALAQASVFRGGFTIAAAERVIDLGEFEGAPPLLDVLQALRDKSLLLAEERDRSARRFTLLAAIRDFGEQKLNAEALGAKVHERHARHFLALGERLVAQLDAQGSGAETEAETGAGDASARRQLRAEHENFLAVHRRFLDREAPPDLSGAPLRAGLIASKSAAAYPYAFSIGLLDAAIARSGAEADPTLLARARAARGDLRRFVGQTRESIEDFEAVRAIADASSDRRLRAIALSGLGNAATVSAAWSEAGALFEEALALVTEGAGPERDRRAEGRLTAMWAATHFNRDDPLRARELLQRSIAAAREHGDREIEAVSVTSLGIVSLAVGALAEARLHLTEGLRFHRAAGARHWEGVALSYLAAAEADAGRLDDALRLFDDALAILREINVRRAVGLALVGSAATCLATGARAEARARYLQALDLVRAMSPDHEGLVLGALGAIDAMEDRRLGASDLLDGADRALAPWPRPAFRAAVALYRGMFDLAEARAAQDAGRAKLEKRARDRLSEGAVFRGRSFEARMAERLLASAIAALDADPAPKHGLVVGTGGLWFRPPKTKGSARLHRRRALARLLGALAEHRLSAPGQAMSIPALVERGWPGERVLPEAGTERVYTAIATLRRLGLRKWLLQKDDGYLLDPEIELVFSSGAP